MVSVVEVFRELLSYPSLTPSRWKASTIPVLSISLMALASISMEKSPVFSLYEAFTPMLLSLSTKLCTVSFSVMVIPLSTPLTNTPMFPALTPRFISLELAEAVVVCIMVVM